MPPAVTTRARLLARSTDRLLLSQHTETNNHQPPRHTHTQTKHNKQDVTELVIETTFKPESCPRKAKQGDRVSVHYAGRLVDGTEFDSSFKRDSPFEFQVREGWRVWGREGARRSCRSALCSCLRHCCRLRDQIRDRNRSRRASPARFPTKPGTQLSNPPTPKQPKKQSTAGRRPGHQRVGQGPRGRVHRREAHAAHPARHGLRSFGRRRHHPGRRHAHL